MMNLVCDREGEKKTVRWWHAGLRCTAAAAPARRTDRVYSGRFGAGAPGLIA
jgi:hypothetical protein